MKIVRVTCDGCGADLTTRSNSVDYRLVLGSESKPGSGAGFYTDMMIYPSLERAHHFCGIGCLDHWRDREKHEAALWREWNDRWQAEHGHKSSNGRVTSWPSMPEETRKAKALEFEAAALVAFPMKHVNQQCATETK